MPQRLRRRCILRDIPHPDCRCLRLPRLIGKTYTEVIVEFLTCLDDDNVDYEEDGDLQDVSGMLVGVKYIKQVRYLLPAQVWSTL